MKPVRAWSCHQVEYQSARSLAADMYIDELETAMSDAAGWMLLDDRCHDDRCHGRAGHGQSPQLNGWLNTVALRASYNQRHCRLHATVSHQQGLEMVCCVRVVSGPCNSFYCLGHFKNVYDDDDDDEEVDECGITMDDHEHYSWIDNDKQKADSQLIITV